MMGARLGGISIVGIALGILLYELYYRRIVPGMGGG